MTAGAKGTGNILELLNLLTTNVQQNWTDAKVSKFFKNKSEATFGKQLSFFCKFKRPIGMCEQQFSRLPIVSWDSTIR
jgi:hypothetical protein